MGHCLAHDGARDSEQTTQLFVMGVVGAAARDRRDIEAIAGSQPRLVLARLAAERGRPAHRDELADLLWPDRLPDSWEAALRNVVSRVRAYLTHAGFDPDVLVHADACWRLQLPAGATVDIELAAREVQQAEAAFAAGRTAAVAVSAAGAEATLAQPFLAGLDGGWVEEVRSRVVSWRLRALTVAAEAHLAEGDSAPAIRQAEQAVAVDPLRETSHRLLMRAHRDGGDRAAGLRAYESCRRMLAEELGVTPDDETESLYLELLGPEPPATPTVGFGSVAAAHHLALAGAGGSPDDVLERAIAAGEDAANRLCWPDAARAYGEALALAEATGAPSSTRLDVLLRLATAEKACGHLDRARFLHLEAITPARRAGDAPAFALAILGLGGGSTSASGFFPDREYCTRLDEARTSLGAGHDGLRAHVAGELALALYWPEDAPRRAELASEALALARAAPDRHGVAGALAASRVALRGPVRTRERLALGSEVTAMALALGDDELVARGRLLRVPDLFELGDRTALEAELTEVGLIAHRLGQPALRWRAASWESLLAVVDGHDEAEHQAAEALAVWGDTPPQDAARAWAAQIMTWRVSQGRAEEILPVIRQAAEAYGATVGAYDCALACALAEVGDRDGSRSVVDRIRTGPGLEGVATSGLGDGWLTTLVLLSEATFVLRDPQVAEELHALLEPYGDRMAVMGGEAGSGFWGSVHTQLGLLLATMDRTDAAAERLAEGVAASERFGARAWARRAERQLATLHAAAHPAR